MYNESMGFKKKFRTAFDTKSKSKGSEKEKLNWQEHLSYTVPAGRNITEELTVSIKLAVSSRISNTQQ